VCLAGPGAVTVNGEFTPEIYEGTQETIKGDWKMTEEKILKGRFAEDKETQKYRRFQISGQGIVGTIYLSKDSKDIPDSIVLKKIAS